MMTKLCGFALLLAGAALGRADGSWILRQATVSYHVSHPLHEVVGTSHQARGEGLCQGGHCDFLIAVPVKSFDSGDSSRDLHMIEAVRGAEFPMIEVRTEIAESEIKAGTVRADLAIQFAGQSAHYKQVPFLVTVQGEVLNLTGTIPAALSDFKIPPPELLMVPIKNEIPVRVEMTWERAQ